MDTYPLNANLTLSMQTKSFRWGIINEIPILSLSLSFLLFLRWNWPPEKSRFQGLLLFMCVFVAILRVHTQEALSAFMGVSPQSVKLIVCDFEQEALMIFYAHKSPNVTYNNYKITRKPLKNPRITAKVNEITRKSQNHMNNRMIFKVTQISHVILRNDLPLAWFWACFRVGDCIKRKTW